MKTSAEKSSTATATPQTSSRPFFARKGEDGFFAPVPLSPTIQTKMTVGKPGDKFEQEADKMADKVMRMPAPAGLTKEEPLASQAPGKIQKKEDEKIRKAPAPEEKVQKKEEEKIRKTPMPDEKLQRKSAANAPAASANVQSGIQSNLTSGQPLSSDVRGFMEPRFAADFSNVRVHTDAGAGNLSNELSARAFTYQNHIFFSPEQYQPGTSQGKELLAHELTHTIQQGHAVQRSPQVSVTTTPPPIQRWGLDDARNKFAEWANLIPGFRMLTIIIGVNPINMQPTDRSAANILRALIELTPIGVLVSQALEKYGVFNKAGAWVEQQIAALGDVGGQLSAAISTFIGSLKLSDVFDLGGVWERAKSIFTGPIARLRAFAESAFTSLIRLVREAILRPLAAMAEGTNAYPLLKAVLGQDPITGDPVPRNADTLIGGFMKLIGQEEIWENLKKGSAVARAWAWFQGALAGVLAFARAIPGQIIETLTSITWQDIVSIVGVFSKVGKAFLSIAGQFFSWALGQVVSLLEILFSVVAPGAVPYIKKAQAAFITIIKNPIAFVGNLVRAGKLGFQMFAGNILTHLKNALIRWLTGPLGEAGVYIPQSFALLEIVKLVLSVFGLTWANIRSKLVKIIPEPVLVVLEKTASVLVTLATQGPAAAWEQIKAEMTELKDQMIAQITQMVTVEVVKAAVMKLVSMINPAGAVVQAILAVWNTVSFFISKISQIAATVAAFIDSISAIAAGQVEPAAKKVEMTMANTLTIIISFLAKLVGLGNIPEKLVGIVKKLRAPIDKGLDKIVAWLGKMLEKLKEALCGKDKRTMKEKERDVKLAKQDAQALLKKSDTSIADIRIGLPPIKSRYKLTRIALENVGSNKFDILVEINPKDQTEVVELDPNRETKYIKDGKLKKEYEGSKKIRPRFYRSNRAYSQAVQKRAKELLALYSVSESEWKDPRNGKIYPKTNYTIEHNPSVGSHWNTQGNNDNQANRVTWFHFEGRAQDVKILSRESNSSEGGENFIPTVGPNFRGPGE